MFVALTVYVLLPFLSSFMPETYASLIVALGGVVALAVFPFLPQLVARYGAQELSLVFASIEMVALLALAIAPGAVAGALLVIITIALQPFISYGLDLLLEATVVEKDTMGRVRTIFLTGATFGSLAAPLLLGALLADSNSYGRIFIAAAAVLVPFVVLFAARSLPRSNIPNVSPMHDTLVCISRDPDLGAATFARFLLYLFSFWISLYVPLYLHEVLSIPWSTIGWILSVMLIPYLLIDYPAGWLADRLLGDKELLFAGFIITGSAVAMLAMLSPTSSIALILSILLISRVGAALIESMSEGHFYRRVSDQDINSMSIFRGIWPLANIVGPVVGSLLLFLGGYQFFFILTGVFLVIAGVITTYRIKDFR